MFSTPGSDYLKKEIEKNLVNCVELVGTRKFLPENRIAPLMTRQNIEIELTTYNVPLTGDLLDFIQGRATRVFLILVYIRKVGLILDFIQHGFYDEHLPITTELCESSENGQIVHSIDEDHCQLPSQHWEFFSRWESFAVEYFPDKQWIFLAPVFRTQKFYQRLDNYRPLPFIDAHESSEGRFSIVHQVSIPEMHLGYEGDRNVVIAMKMFHIHNEGFFQKEVELLEKIHDLNHDHLIKPLAAFDNGSLRCVLFPWCDGGNLQDYWKKPRERPDADSISWTMQQMAGLCECLKWLWDRNFRHGDLKPANILHKGGRGDFLIADVGISRIHVEVTEERNTSTSTIHASFRYESPEYRTNHENHTALSRDSDIWSMGVVLLEWLLWLLEYPDGLKIIKNDERYWQKDEQGPPRVNPKCRNVMQEMNDMISANTTDHCFKHLLDLIQSRLLVVQLAREGESLESGRAKATELSKRMSEIQANYSYSREPISWERVGIAQGVPMISYSIGGNSSTMDDSLTSAQYAPQRPDRYDEANR